MLSIARAECPCAAGKLSRASTALGLVQDSTKTKHNCVAGPAQHSFKS
jgi:hypothetical protein